MKEIRTRPKKRDIQTRQTTAFLPKQAAKVLREQAVRRQFKSKNNMPEEEQTSPYQEPVERFQTKEQRAAEISSRHGVPLRPRRWRKSNSTANSVPQSRKTTALHPLQRYKPNRRKSPMLSRDSGRHRPRSRPNAVEKLRISWKSMKPHRCRRILQRWSSR